MSRSSLAPVYGLLFQAAAESVVTSGAACPECFGGAQGDTAALPAVTLTPAAAGEPAIRLQVSLAGRRRRGEA